MCPEPDPLSPPTAQQRAAVMAGHTGDSRLARSLLGHPDPRTRASALSALVRLDTVTETELETALRDADPSVRRRAAVDVAHSGAAPSALLDVLRDPDPTVVEVASWAAGELTDGDPEALHALVEALIDIALNHDDSLCRESAVAALGSVGDPIGKTAVLAACSDRATVRRRAVLALAAFDGDDVTAMLHQLLGDRDLQVRQAAEDLLSILEGTEIGGPELPGYDSDSDKTT